MVGLRVEWGDEVVERVEWGDEVAYLGWLNSGKVERVEWVTKWPIWVGWWERIRKRGSFLELAGGEACEERTRIENRRG